MDPEISLHINVTRDEIENGLRGKADCCPIALAVIHALEKEDITYDGIEVDGGIKIIIDRDEYRWDYRVKDYQKVNDFIKAFDNEDFVSPFELDCEFELFIDEEYYNDDFNY